MHRIILAIAATLSVQPACAESIWLVIRYGGNTSDAGRSLEKIEMKSFEQCEEQGALWTASERYVNEYKGETSFGYTCIEGK